MKKSNLKRRLPGAILAAALAVSMAGVSGLPVLAASGDSPAAVSDVSASAEGSDEALSLTPDVTWYNTEDDTFVLTTADELAGLAAIVDGTASGISQDGFKGKTILLDEDIDIGGLEWEPIGELTVSSSGTYTIGYAFEGTFDGQDHRISGLYCTDENGGVALFGNSSGTLENFILSGTVYGNYCTAGVACVASGTICGVINQANVYAEGNWVGGIVGIASGDLVITDCHNQGEISNGGASSEKSTGRVGGIIGSVDTGVTAEITECSNSGNITAYQYGAGIIGGAFGYVTVDACCNTGDIQTVSFGKTYLGSIAGKLENGTVSNCYNTGNLYDSHWMQGHIRAVGGIVGCEEGHSEGTAVSNCYTTGEITLNTSNMVYGTNYIYETGNISGGNSSTSANTMHYANCFYLEGRIAIADPDHEDYRFWSDVYKNDPLAYDTEDIISVTEDQLAGMDTEEVDVLDSLGEYFVADTEGANDGYPILYWQVDYDLPEITCEISGTVSGGSAVLDGLPTEASKGAAVSFSVTEIEDGMQIQSVTVMDVSGAEIAVSQTGENNYTFEMPARSVTVTVTLETLVDDDAAYYAYSVPEGLDAIWDIQVSSTYMDSEEGTIQSGAVVEVTVTKQKAAITTDFTGISVNDGEVSVTETETKTGDGALYLGVYTFVMPEEAVSIALEGVSYMELTVTESVNGVENTAGTLTRADMLELAAENGVGYCSGWESETTAYIIKCESYVTLEQVLQSCGISLEEDDSVIVTSADGMNLTYTWEYLYGEERNYYPGIFDGDSSGAVSAEPMLTIQSNMLLSSDEGTLSDLVCDTLYAYRFIFGQTQEEYQNSTKAVDKQPKSVCAITVVRGQTQEEPGITGLYADEDGMLAYYADGVVDTAYTGIAAAEDGTVYYVEAGYVGNYTGLAKDPSDGTWYYFTESVLDEDYTGLVKNAASGILYYVADGTLDWTYTGPAKYAANDCWYYVADGTIDWTYTGLAKNAANEIWYYFAYGTLDWSYSGAVKHSNGVWYYVSNGQLDWTFSGEVTTENGTFAFENGTIVW